MPQTQVQVQQTLKRWPSSKVLMIADKQQGVNCTVGVWTFTLENVEH